MGWFVCSGECPFYSLIVEAELTDRAMVGVSLRASKGQGEVAMACTASWRASGASGRTKWATGSFAIIACPCSLPTAMAEGGVVHKQVQGRRRLASVSGR